MRQLAGFVVAGAVLAAAIYLTVEFTFFEPSGRAVPDFSLPTLLLLGLLTAALMAMLMGVVAEIRHLRDRRRDHDWSITTGGGPRGGGASPASSEASCGRCRSGRAGPTRRAREPDRRPPRAPSAGGRPAPGSRR